MLFVLKGSQYGTFMKNGDRGRRQPVFFLMAYENAKGTQMVNAVCNPLNTSS